MTNISYNNMPDNNISDEEKNEDYKKQVGELKSDADEVSNLLREVGDDMHKMWLDMLAKMSPENQEYYKRLDEFIDADEIKIGSIVVGYMHDLPEDIQFHIQDMRRGYFLYENKSPTQIQLDEWRYDTW